MGGFEGTGGWSRERACKQSEALGSTLTEPRRRIASSVTPVSAEERRARARAADARYKAAHRPAILARKAAYYQANRERLIADAIRRRMAA